MKRQDKTIIIIGAGASGLMAAKRLAKRYKIIVLEADIHVRRRIHTEAFRFLGRLTGRIYSWKLPVTLKLLKEV
jgi:flavin-dependent dehydrogenase